MKSFKPSDPCSILSTSLSLSLIETCSSGSLNFDPVCSVSRCKIWTLDCTSKQYLPPFSHALGYWVLMVVILYLGVMDVRHFVFFMLYYNVHFIMLELFSVDLYALMILVCLCIYGWIVCYFYHDMLFGVYPKFLDFHILPLFHFFYIIFF